MKGVFATRVSGSADLYQVLLCYFFMGMLVYPLLTILLARLSLLSATTSFWDLQFAQCFCVLSSSIETMQLLSIWSAAIFFS